MKKIILSILAFSILLSSIPVYGVSVNAQTTSEYSTELTATAQDFIDSIEKSKGISIDDQNIEVIANEDGTVSIQQQITSDEYKIYTSLSEKEINDVDNNPNERWVAAVYKGAVWLFKAYNGVKFACEVIEKVNGEDTCKYIGQQIKDGLAQSTKTKWEVKRTLVKESCPYPPNSAGCNQPPFAYWETSVVKVG